MKVKIEVNSWNNYSPPPTHTSREGGGGLFDLPCTKDNYSLMRNCSMGPVDTKNSYCLRKKAYLDYIKLHGVHGNPSGTVVGSFASRPKISTCVLHILSKIFSLFH